MQCELFVAYIIGVVVGAGLACTIRLVIRSSVDKVCKASTPPVPNFDRKPLPPLPQSAPPKYNPLTRKIDHRN